MSNILFVDACVRRESRTRGLAQYLLEKLGGSVTTVALNAEPIQPLDEASLARRTEKAADGDFSDPMFRFARQLAAADEIVIAAPYWDLSIPAALRCWIENVNVPGIVFRYGEDGIPHSLCRASRMIFVTTAGGPIVSDEAGYGYVSTICTRFWGVPETLCFRAEGLDIDNADVGAILQACRDEIDKANL